jgi:hypothetical protein
VFGGEKPALYSALKYRRTEDDCHRPMGYCSMWSGRSLTTDVSEVLTAFAIREAVNTSETSANFYQTTRLDIP